MIRRTNLRRSHVVLGLALSFALAALGACSDGDEAALTVAVSGRSIVITGGVDVRGLVLDIELAGATSETTFELGADATRLNLFRATVADDGKTARLLLTDSRKIALPASGEIAVLGGTGAETFRIASASAAGSDGEDISVKVVH